MSKPVGAYSTFRVIGNQLYVSGQIPDDVNADIRTQTKQVLDKIKSIIEQAGFKLSDIMKCTVFLADINDFAAMNEVYGNFFTQPYPCRSAVANLDIVKKVKVEIDCFAVKQ